MTDIMSPEKRSALMARIRGRDTGPERELAALLAPYRFRLETQAGDLPGRPDFVSRRRKVAIFVDGDFWHGWRFPAWSMKLSPQWRDKIETNRQRDARNIRRLRRAGWSVIRVWDHQLKRNRGYVVERVVALLRSSPLR